MDFNIVLRKAMGEMSISELSRQCGVPISTISRHLHGEHQPTLQALEAYERALPHIRELRTNYRPAPKKKRRRSR